MKAYDIIRNQIITHRHFHKGGLVGDATSGWSIWRPYVACPEGWDSEHKVKDATFIAERLKVSHVFSAGQSGKNAWVIVKMTNRRLENKLAEELQEYKDTLRENLLKFTRKVRCYPR